MPVILDDRIDATIGSKIKDAKVLGTPYLGLLGDKTSNGEIEVENSRTGKKAVIPQEKLAEILIENEKSRIGNPDFSLENFIDFE